MNSEKQGKKENTLPFISTICLWYGRLVHDSGLNMLLLLVVGLKLLPGMILTTSLLLRLLLLFYLLPRSAESSHHALLLPGRSFIVQVRIASHSVNLVVWERLSVLLQCSRWCQHTCVPREAVSGISLLAESIEMRHVH